MYTPDITTPHTMEGKGIIVTATPTATVAGEDGRRKHLPLDPTTYTLHNRDKICRKICRLATSFERSTLADADQASKSATKLTNRMCR
jgi:hypothetical protein